MPAPKGHPPYAGCETGGRPNTHNDEFIEKEAEALIAWIHNEKNKAIFFNEFAIQRRYSAQRLSDFANRNEKFKEALQLARDWQENKLIMGGLTKKYDSHFAKFVMPRKCGEHWQEQKNLNITTNGPVPEWIAEAESKSKDLISD